MFRRSSARPFVFALLLAMAIALCPVRARAQEVSLELPFYSASYGESLVGTFPYDDDWFAQDSTVYNHKLAQGSYGMAVSAFRPIGLDQEAQVEPDAKLRSYFAQCGFEDVRSDDYEKVPALYTVSTDIARKELVDEQGPYTLLACGVCGGGYRNEWLSNFSMGTDTIHAGFRQAAGLVCDRIFAYVAENHIGGRVKLWVAGYSRAAAVSNVVGALMDDYDVFDDHDIFVYTFATPRTTKAENAASYQNIFNIVGKMDPVTHVGLPDWGYTRYGTSLMTPCQETDSDYAARISRASVPYEAVTGVKLWNNPALNDLVGQLFGYFYAIVPAPEVYAEHVQERLAGLWSNPSAPKIYGTLLDMASDPVLITEENRTEADGLLDFVSAVCVDYFTGTSFATQYWEGRAGASGNITHEHQDDVYYAWLFSSDNPDEIFTDATDYTRVIVSGDVDIDVSREGRVVQSVSDEGTSTGETLFNGSPVLAVFRQGDTTVATIPHDRHYEVTITSDSQQDILVCLIDCSTELVSNRSWMHVLSMAPGESASIDPRDHSDSEGRALDRSEIGQLSPTFITLIEHFNVFQLSWRAICAIMLTILLICASLLVSFLGTLLESGAAMTSKWRLERIRSARRLPAVRAGVLRLLSSLAISSVVVGEVLFGISQYGYGPGVTYRAIGTALIALLALMAAARTRRWYHIVPALGLVAASAVDAWLCRKGGTGIFSLGLTDAWCGVGLTITLSICLVWVSRAWRSAFGVEGAHFASTQTSAAVAPSPEGTTPETSD